jgi:signal peptidase I
MLTRRPAQQPAPQAQHGRNVPAWLRASWRVTRLVTAVASRTAACTLTGLLLWAVLPALLPGWTTTVVESGSMRPAINPGDIVAYQPLHGRTPTKGQVILARDPNRPSRLLTHRVRTVRRNNTLITQGDANPVPDRLPVRPSALRGLARIRVPCAGLPAQLWRSGQHLTAAALVAGIGLALTLAAPYPKPPRRRPAAPPPAPDPTQPTIEIPVLPHTPAPTSPDG